MEYVRPGDREHAIRTLLLYIPTLLHSYTICLMLYFSGFALLE